jgi:hypothetical protein
MNEMYLGLGISKGYVKLVKSLITKLVGKNGNLDIIIADEPNRNFNNITDNSEWIEKKIWEESNHLVIPNFNISTHNWSYISSNEIFRKYFEMYCEKYIEDDEFKSEVNSLVYKNRCDVISEDISRRAKYVLSELSLILTMQNKKKIGPPNEIFFDNLSIKYNLGVNITKDNFEYL